MRELTMNAAPQLDLASRSLNNAEAFYFHSGRHKLFTWLHQPHGMTRPKVGLVICKPFGYEAVYAHAGMRAFAEAAAAVGVPTLRFDYAGTGDSADLAPEVDQLQTWTGDIIAAIEELQRRAGVEQICLLGFRLGGLLALEVAGRCKVVSAIILVSPIIRGKKYLRELRTTSLASILGVPEDKSPDAGLPGSVPANEGDMEVAGFTLSAASLRTLSQTDFTAMSAPPVPDLLIIDGASLPTARRWAESLLRNEARIKYMALPGLIEMLMTPPHLGSVPEEMVGAARDWLSEYLASVQADSEIAVDLPLKKTQSSDLRLSVSTPNAHQTEQTVETPVLFGPDSILFGIITEPRPGAERRGAVILLNAGGSYHVGASRMYVQLARQWAGQGFVVLRMDYAGLGDSGVRLGRPWNDIFPPSAIDDIGAGIKLLQQNYGVTAISLGGLCAGAYHALHAAIADLPVTRIMMVNPLYFWHDANSLDDVQRAEVVRDSGAYRHRTLSLDTWIRLLKGQIHIRFVLKTYARRFAAELGAASRDVARRLHIHLPRDLGVELERIANRGVRIVFVFAPGEPGINLLHLQAGASLRRLQDRCHVHIVERGDHVFSKRGPREALAQILSDELYAA